ncbi:PR/SET domain 13 [Musca autumnalis]|uniref:PR/SET domain 13 n=1 Tax=Musca autumnalis TaxID=221902 RepID=UPI003CF47B08
MLPVLPTSHSIVQQQNHHLVDNTRGNNQNQSPTAHSPNKRNSSMIFRIEHLLPQTAANTAPRSSSPPPAPSSPPSTTRPEKNGSQSSSSSSPKKSKIIRAGVHVTQLIPKDTVSVSIDSHALIAASTTEVANEPMARAYCSLSPKGDVLILNASIMRKIKLSEDIHSYNGVFELAKNGQVQLRVVRDIQRDEEIVAWFGEELTLLMAIPFLTPLNIQGNNRYMCHWCHLTFETPNPLKIHLALGCGRHNIDVLWIRLHYALRAKQYSQQLFTLPLVSETSPLRTSPTLASSSTTTTANSSGPQTTTTTSSMVNLSPSYSPPVQPQTSSPPPAAAPATSRFSAFKPISLATTSTHSHPHHPPTSLPVSLATALGGTPHLHTSTAAHMSFLPSLSSAGFPHMSLLHPQPSTNPLNAAAQIEAIVSNMGASKQGHLCIYCGKMYSRKYGLKIHIRTHTGFKPLKCKYCLRPFGDPSNLNKHIRLHLQSAAQAGGHSSGAEAYQCTLCHKTFARRRDLQKHVENRHADASSTAESKMDTAHSD